MTDNTTQSQEDSLRAQVRLLEKRLARYEAALVGFAGVFVFFAGPERLGVVDAPAALQLISSLILFVTAAVMFRRSMLKPG